MFFSSKYDAGAAVDAPDFTPAAYTAYTCLICKYSYTSGNVGALGHTRKEPAWTSLTLPGNGVTVTRSIYSLAAFKEYYPIIKRITVTDCILSKAGNLENKANHAITVRAPSSQGAFAFVKKA